VLEVVEATEGFRRKFGEGWPAPGCVNDLAAAKPSLFLSSGCGWSCDRFVVTDGWGVVSSEETAASISVLDCCETGEESPETLRGSRANSSLNMFGFDSLTEVDRTDDAIWSRWSRCCCDRAMVMVAQPQPLEGLQDLQVVSKIACHTQELD